jgi:hypothetical protein
MSRLPAPDVEQTMMGALKNPVFIAEVQKNLGLPDGPMARWIMALLTMRPVANRGPQELLNYFRSADVSRWPRHLYVMTSMLAMLQVIFNHSEFPDWVDPVDLSSLYDRITGRHWDDPQYGMSRTRNLGVVARRLGELSYSDRVDVGFRTLVSYLFEMALSEAMGWLRHSFDHPHLKDEAYIVGALKQDRIIDNPRTAAQIQFSVIVQSALKQNLPFLPWMRVYSFARRIENPVDGEAIGTLSGVGREIIREFIGSDLSQPEHHLLGIGENEEHAGVGWKVYLPDLLFHQVGIVHPIYSFIESDMAEGDAAEFSRIFRTVYLPVLVSSSHINKAKYIDLIVDLWRRGVIEKLAFGGSMDEIVALTPIYYLEIHPEDHCQNRCISCRG